MSNIQSGSPGVGPVQQPLDNQTPQNAISPSGVIFFDKLTPSETKALLEQIFQSQNPLLIPPAQFTIDPNNQASAATAIGIGTVGEAEETKHQIIMKILDEWINSIHKIAEESKRRDLKREIDEVATAYNAYKHEMNTTEDPNFAIFAVGIVLGTLGIHQSLMVTPPSETAFNPVAQIAQSIPPMIAEKLNTATELGLIGTLVIFGYGIQYAAAAESVKNAREKAGEESDPHEKARSYANNVLVTLGSPSFNNGLVAVITQNAGEGQPVNDQQKAVSVIVVKLVMLVSALQALYQADNSQGMNGKIFARILSEGRDALQFPAGDPKNTFIDHIKFLFAALKEPELEDRLKRMLVKYLDNNPTFKGLDDPEKVLSGVYANLPKGDLSI